jgi:hypothetical protein
VGERAGSRDDLRTSCFIGLGLPEHARADADADEPLNPSFRPYEPFQLAGLAIV